MVSLHAADFRDKRIDAGEVKTPRLCPHGTQQAVQSRCQRDQKSAGKFFWRLVSATKAAEVCAAHSLLYKTDCLPSEVPGGVR